MIRNNKNVLTSSLLGANNNTCLLNEKKDNYDIESLRN